MGREAAGKWNGGVRDNNQTNDRIQVFAFARQPLCCLHSLRQLMVSDYSSVIGCQSQEARQQALTGRNDKLKRWRGWREREGGHVAKGVFDKEWASECFSSGISLPLLLTFGWTFKWDPPSWLLLCKVRKREREKPGRKYSEGGSQER